ADPGNVEDARRRIYLIPRTLKHRHIRDEAPPRRDPVIHIYVPDVLMIFHPAIHRPRNIVSPDEILIRAEHAISNRNGQIMKPAWPAARAAFVRIAEHCIHRRLVRMRGHAPLRGSRAARAANAQNDCRRRRSPAWQPLPSRVSLLHVIERHSHLLTSETDSHPLEFNPSAALRPARCPEWTQSYVFAIPGSIIGKY